MASVVRVETEELGLASLFGDEMERRLSLGPLCMVSLFGHFGLPQGVVARGPSSQAGSKLQYKCPSEPSVM